MTKRYIPKKRGDYWYLWDTKTRSYFCSIPLIDRKTAQKYAEVENYYNQRNRP